ncbi:uncharacterized protein LOC108027657 [Drosophila biarmipes]|uniref:uncharacterized protein LOC108027657 n=1 Tax=Drosophila biarmipes TaxID=125945 RepID=UPI0007E650F9|nr:uncharacterized protein LOC108027657 [Drosophila biarmipes]
MLGHAVILFYVIVAGCTSIGTLAAQPKCAGRGNRSEELQKHCDGYCFPAIRPVLVQLQTLKDELSTLKIQQGFKMIGSDLYHIEEADEVGWNDAVNMCRKYNAHLVVVKDEKEEKALKAQLDFWNSYWVGIGESKPAKGDCPTLTTYGMRDIKCFKKSNFICKAD